MARQPAKKLQFWLVTGAVTAATGAALFYCYSKDPESFNRWYSDFKDTVQEAIGIEKAPAAFFETSEDKAPDGVSTHLNPWETRVCVLTFGCSHNASDGEYMKGVLKEDGFILVDEVDEAHCVVINSCTVKNPSQDSAMNLVKKCSAKGQKLVVGGCVPQAEHTLPWLKDVSLIGVEQLANLPEIVTQAVNGQRLVMLKAKKDNPSLMLPKVRRNELVEIIPINQGCLGRCTYCKTRFARGTLSSYPKEQILDRVIKSVNEGATQIWLTSEDTGAYGLDFDYDYVLHHLLNDICDALDAMPESKYQSGETRVKVRVGMTNPPYILNQLTQLAELFATRRQLFRFLHLPIQSGSDSVLSNMIRDYTVDDFNQCVAGLRSRISNPPIKFSTDIICAFPYETDADHKETLDLLVDAKIDAVNISQYYARPGTAAAKMKQVAKSIAKTRTKEVTNVFNAYETFQYTVGSEVPVWFSEMSERSPHVVGHTDAYVKVLVDPVAPQTMEAMARVGIDTGVAMDVVSNSPSTDDVTPTLSDDEKDDLLIDKKTVTKSASSPLLGHCAIVKITRATKWHIEGTVVEVMQ